MRWRGVVIACVVLLVPLGRAETPATWRQAGPDYPWSFPADHHAHAGYKTEWWYVTGELTAADGRAFGYQFTIFRVGLLPAAPAVDSAWSAGDLVMGHAAITDIAAAKHAFSETLYRAAAGLGGFGAPGDSVLAWSRAPAGTPGRWQMRLNDDASFTIVVRDDRQGLAFDLRLAPQRPPVLQGEGGFSVKDPARRTGSQYYSLTRLDTRGTVVSQGATATVTGLSWLDREFSSAELAPEQVGWDWFSLQLDDGRDLMLYRMRGGDGGTAAASGTLVDPDGTVRYLTRDDWQLTPLRTWRSPETGGEYPVVWRVTVPGADLDLEVAARLDAQENVSRRTGDLVYWEGAVLAKDRAHGAVRGRGYLELTGYAGSRLPM